MQRHRQARCKAERKGTPEAVHGGRGSERSLQHGFQQLEAGNFKHAHKEEVSLISPFFLGLKCLSFCLARKAVLSSL